MRFSAIKRLEAWRRAASNHLSFFSPRPSTTANYSGGRTQLLLNGWAGDQETPIPKAASWPWASPSVGRACMTTSSAKAKEMGIEIMSVEDIKPASPTPQHLRTFRVSLLDQLLPHMYVVPLVYFFPNDEKTGISERRQLLKQSLLKTLVRFFPLAGKVKDHLSIECNDDGVYYVEARINTQLSDFLRHPNQKLIHGLLPFHPSSMELFSKTHVAMIQVNIFDCGGIAIGIYTSHKIMDGQSIVTFMNAWAATARGSSEEICPSFISSSVFHQNPRLPTHTSLLMPPPQTEQSKSVTKRFVFDASALVALKNKAINADSNVTNNPSRVTAAMGLIWQCAIATSEARLGFRKQSILTYVVNLRPRNSPPLPPYSMGNIFWVTYAQRMPNEDLELPSMVERIRNGITKLDDNFLEDIKGKDGSLDVMKHLKELEEVHTGNVHAEYLSLSSICNGGIYEADFGWGKPIWTCIGSAGIDALGLPNLVVFMDTRSGDGIEAWVTLKEKEMAIFEKIPELLSFASLDPSPLELSSSSSA